MSAESSYAYWVGGMLATLRIVVRETGNKHAIQMLRQFGGCPLADDRDRARIEEVITAGGKKEALRSKPFEFSDGVSEAWHSVHADIIEKETA